MMAPRTGVGDAAGRTTTCWYCWNPPEGTVKERRFGWVSLSGDGSLWRLSGASTILVTENGERKSSVATLRLSLMPSNTFLPAEFSGLAVRLICRLFHSFRLLGSKKLLMLLPFSWSTSSLSCSVSCWMRLQRCSLWISSLYDCSSRFLLSRSPVSCSIRSR
mgnify:CR=1 FL=1